MTAAPTGTAVDQRTGQPAAIGSLPSATQAKAGVEAKREAEKSLRAEVAALLELRFTSQVNSQVVDQRKVNALVKAELERLEASPDGLAGAVAGLREAVRSAAKASAKAREKEITARRAAAVEDTKRLLAEMESRSAWVFANILANKANDQRLQELIDELAAIEGQHHLGIELGRYVRLPGDCAALAGQRLQIEGRIAADGYLPALEQCPELPEEFQRPAAAVANPATNQVTRAPHDPNLPKDHALRMAAAAVPLPRNPDGTIAGGSIGHPFEGNRTAVVPRTDAEDLAAHRAVAKELDAELEQVEAGA